MTSVTVRFFAAARAASGCGERVVRVADPATVESALAEVRAELAESERAAFDSVVARCSFLVNAVATREPEHPLVDGDVVDVLPPFAGG